MSLQSTSSSPRSGQSTIGLPVQRVEQLRSLAKARGHSTLVALVEDVIRRAAEDGEISGDVPGYLAFTDDDVVCINFRDEVRPPLMSRHKAALIATILDAAAGVSVAPAHFTLSSGKAIPVDLDTHTLTIGRHGRGVLVWQQNKATGEIERIAEHVGIIADFAGMIRRAVQNA